MAQLQSDQHGFLLGDPIDLGRMPKYLLDIKSDVAAIKRAVVGSPGSAKQRTANIPATMPNRDASGRFIRNSENSSAPAKNRSGVTIATPIGNKKTADSAIGDNGTAIEKGLVDRLRPAFNKSAVTPKKRDTSGRFTGDGEGSGSRDGSPRVVTALANRLSALAGIGSGMEEADPTIKAFKEVAEPMKRGFEFFGGGKDDKQTKWLRNILGVLKLSRKEETVYQKATQKTLRAIEGKPGGGGDDGDNSGIMTILAARLGPALLAGITAVLGFIFSPIGLAIGAASAVAWGLFTESGQKFFGEVGAKIIAGWDAVTTAFAPITESISKDWATVKGGFDSLISGMVSSWDAFTGFLKDKFGIDIPAIFKPVVDVSKKVVESATETVKGGVDVAKETAGKAIDAVQKSSPKTTEALGNVWDKVTEGAGKIASHATGKTAANKAAMLNEMAAQGITDPNEQAMLMAEVDHESGGFTKTKENLNYRSGRLMEVSKTARDKGRPAVDAAVAQGEDGVAELMYGGRMGNTEKGDGAKYKGRGLIQLTGKDNYAAASKDLGIDLVNHPELAETPEVAAKTAMWFWKKNKLGDSAKRGDVKTNRHGVNGGEIGLAEVEKKRDKYLVEANNGELNASPAETKPAVASISDDPTQGGVNKLAAINAGDMSTYNRLSAGPSNTASTVSAPVPSAPVMPTSPKIADAPPVIEPLSTPEQRPIMVSVAAMDATQDVSDKRIAHIASGGISG